MQADDFWLTHAKLVTPRGVVEGSAHIRRGRVAAIRRRAPKHQPHLSVAGCYVAPGFIDLHLWGDPWTVARKAVRGGTTAFFTAIGPEPLGRMVQQLTQLRRSSPFDGAECLGVHLEGPFLNPTRGGALPARFMRRPTTQELGRLARAAGGRVRLMTMAPELPGAMAAIHWCCRHRIVVSLGHSAATYKTACRAIDAGARAVTHVFNGMPRLDPRRPSLLEAALTEPRLAAMVILDGVHISPAAFRLLVRAKGADRIVLVTDSIRYAPGAARARDGAFYLKSGVLAGSGLTMVRAVQHAVAFGGMALHDAVRMATINPARLMGLERSRGTVEEGKRADLVVFDQHFLVQMTMVGGRPVYQETIHT
jgi:N-acetylglucosamine-6-phosphate deacetylase